MEEEWRNVWDDVELRLRDVLGTVHEACSFSFHRRHFLPHHVILICFLIHKIFVCRYPLNSSLRLLICPSIMPPSTSLST